MEGASRRSLGPQAQHTHSMEDHTWSIQKSTSNHTQQLHHLQQQNIKHLRIVSPNNSQTPSNTQHTNQTDLERATQNIQGYNITLTTSQVQEAIKQSKNNNSQGPAKINIGHPKHIGPLGLAFLTSMFKTALNKKLSLKSWLTLSLSQNPTKTQTRVPHTGPYPSSR